MRKKKYIYSRWWKNQCVSACAVLALVVQQSTALVKLSPPVGFVPPPWETGGFGVRLNFSPGLSKLTAWLGQVVSNLRGALLYPQDMGIYVLVVMQPGPPARAPDKEELTASVLQARFRIFSHHLLWDSQCSCLSFLDQFDHGTHPISCVVRTPSWQKHWYFLPSFVH